jgi:cellulose synthase/poly-beta-1,6-N-acetylglucosamine synthase-like glycosyltransferase
MEFVGFSGYVQEARDSLGSVGLGGNGQFTRLAALAELAPEPWSDCLTEDLDLGLALVEGGWRIRFCPNAFVLQQGVDRMKPLLRQRARWFQGHYQCWAHLPDVARSSQIRFLTKVDLTLYLVMVVFVVVITLGAVAALADGLGLVVVENALMARMPPGVVARILALVISIAPVSGFVWTYQRRSQSPLRPWEVPAYASIFVVYTYAMVVAQVWAWLRMATGRESWAKTARVAVKPVTP